MDYVKELEQEFIRLNWHEAKRKEVCLSFLRATADCPGEPGEDLLTYLKRQPRAVTVDSLHNCDQKTYPY